MGSLAPGVRATLVSIGWFMVTWLAAASAIIIMGATFRQILLLFAIFNPDKFRLILLGLVMPRRFLLAAAVTAAFLVGESTATEEASLVTL